MSDLEAILSDDPIPEMEGVEETIEEEVEEAVEEVEVAEEAANEAEPETGEQETPPPGDGQNMIPAAVATALRKEKRQLKEEMEALKARSQQPPQEQQEDPVEFYADPEKALTQHAKMIATQQFNQKLDMSEMVMRSQVGDEVVDSATDAFLTAKSKDPSLDIQLRNAPNPYGFVVNWHKQQTALAEIGTDPEAYKSTLREELKKELQEELAAQAASEIQAPTPTAPPSLSKTPNLGKREQPQWSGPTSLDELFS